MRQPSFKKSLRQTCIDNQAALDSMAALSGKPRVVLYEAKPLAVRRPNGFDGTPLEKDIQKAILQYLSACPSVVFAGRFNRGTAMSGDGLGNVRYTKFNSVRGFPDVHGLLAGGAAFYIEVKRPGKNATEDQQDFIDMVKNGGGIAFVARSVDDVIEGLF